MYMGFSFSGPGKPGSYGRVEARDLRGLGEGEGDAEVGAPGGGAGRPDGRRGRTCCRPCGRRRAPASLTHLGRTPAAAAEDMAAT
jgi:hypothetical protein